MAKLFISQPMRGLTDEEIKNNRESAIECATHHIHEVYGPDEPVEVLDSFFEGAPAQAHPLWYLGESIKMLGQADVAFFCDGWNEARGCIVEMGCAIKYDIPLLIHVASGNTSIRRVMEHSVVDTCIRQKG